MAVRKRKVNTKDKKLQGYTVDSFKLDVIILAEMNKAKNLATKLHDQKKREVEKRMEELDLKSFTTKSEIEGIYSAIELTMKPKSISTIHMDKLKKLSSPTQYEAMVTTSMKAIENEVGVNIKDQVVSYSLGDNVMGMKIKKTNKSDEG